MFDVLHQQLPRHVSSEHLLNFDRRFCHPVVPVAPSAFPNLPHERFLSTVDLESVPVGVPLLLCPRGDV